MAIAQNGHNGKHGNLWPGHFCPQCNGTVRPGAIYESATIAPEAGKKGDPILLHSLNARLSHDNPDEPGRFGYCFNCKEWVFTYRKSQLDVRYEYATRDNVEFRFNDRIIHGGDKVKLLVNAIEARADERRLGAGVMRTTTRRRR